MQKRNRWSFGLTSIGVVMVLAFGSALALPQLRQWYPGAGTGLVDVTTVAVARTDMSVMLTTGGKVECTERTVIECELERLDVSVRGQALAGGGASTIISVIPDGTTVKKGEVLCELDSSEYREMLRQQKMTVKRSVADHRQAELDLDVARMSVVEFQEGTMKEASKELAGLIALNESSWQRVHDRLGWARRMLEKGYVPISQIGTEVINEQRAAFQLQQSRTEYSVFRAYTAPKALRSLEGKVRGAEAILNYQERRLQRHRERQELLELQVERCTIRAPHDGFVIYARDDQRTLPIEEGMSVHQKQNLFYLPNMSGMLAQVMVHESVASRVKPGMRAKVRVEGLPGQLLEGHVRSVAQLPSANWLNDVRYFYTEITLDSIPRGLMPGMTAEVEIATERRLDVLAIPIEALAIEEGHDVCYVASDDGVERRQIEVGQSNEGMLEVTEGLDEGEQVVLNPAPFDSRLEPLEPFSAAFTSRLAELPATAD